MDSHASKSDTPSLHCSTLGYSATRASIAELDWAIEDPRFCFLTNLDTGQVLDLRHESSPRSNSLWGKFFPWAGFKHYRYVLCREERLTDLQRLWSAVRVNNAQEAEAVLRAGALPQAQGLHGWTPLHISASNGYLETSEVLLHCGAWVDAVSEAGCTALHLAAEKGSVPLMLLLVRWGADVDAQDNALNTPLHYAARKDRLETVQVLLAHKAACLRNNVGETAWDCAGNSAVRQMLEARTGYGRVDFNGAVLRSSRRDVVERLLRLTTTPVQVRPYRFLSQRMRVSRPDPLHQYALLAVLGSGSFGHVYLAKHKETGRFYALKMLSKRLLTNKQITKYALTEKQVLQSLTHPFIVRLHRTFQTPSKLVFVLDYCAGSTLSDLLADEGRLNESRARVLISELVLALEAIHTNRVVYRDLKPDNVLLTAQGHAVLCDFGLAKADLQGTTSTFCGTAAYLAPEVLRGVPHSFEVDWYALGELLYELLTDRIPHYAATQEELFASILAGQVTFPRYVSLSAKDLITRLMCSDPGKRLGHNGAEEVKSHPFFDTINWVQVYNKELPVQPPDIRPLVKTDDLEVESKAGSFLSNWSNR